MRKNFFRLKPNFYRINIIIFIYSFFLLLGSNSIAQNINGKWKLDANLPNIGTMQILLDFKQTSDTAFIAESRPKVLKNIMGGIKYALAINNEKFKNGAIIHIYNGRIIGDSLKGTLTTSSANFEFGMRLKNNKMSGNLFLSSQEKNSFTITAAPYTKELIDYDYIGLSKEIKKSFQLNIYDPELLNSKEWIDFFKKLDNLSAKAQDDLEMFLYFNYLVKDIKLSHISISKYNPSDVNDKIDSANNTSKVEELFFGDKAACLKFTGFQLADSLLIRNFFKKIVKEQWKNLILDFRGCSGGDQSSMYLARFFTKTIMDAGFFIGNKYYQANRNLPTESEIDKLPVYNASSVKDFLQLIIDNGILKGKVIPDNDLRYTGKVYVLIDKKSASATEPISYFFKQHSLATLVGETTAGKMVSSKVFTVKDKWSLLVPIADYYTSDRFRIEQNGVPPAITINSKEALDYVLKNLNLP